MSDTDEPGGSSAALPRSKLQKMIRDRVPPGQRVSAELLEKLCECCTEFVEMISSSANEISTQEKKATIFPEHVIAALDQLGFSELKEGVAAYWEQWKADQKAARKPKRKTGAEKAGMSEEEQIALQQKMFAEAKAQAVNNGLI